MAAKKPKPRANRTTPSSTQPTLTGVILKGLIAASFVVLVVASIAWVGNQASQELVNRARYTIPWTEIQCEAPPGSDRATFLTEVRYLSQLPETIQSLDPELKPKLSAAFARHPWVAEVRDVVVTPAGTVEMQLTFRTPILAVRVSGEPEPRVVAHAGILLPSSTPWARLPLLVTSVLPPIQSAGQVWPDPTVTRAAELAELHKPKQIEKTDKGWRLIRENAAPLIVSW